MGRTQFWTLYWLWLILAGRFHECLLQDKLKPQESTVMRRPVNNRASLVQKWPLRDENDYTTKGQTTLRFCILITWTLISILLHKSFYTLCRSSENFRFLLVTQKHRGGIWFILQHVNKPKHKAKVIKNWLHQQEQDRWRLAESPELESMEPGFLGLHAVTEDIKSAWIYSTAFKMLETAYLLFANSAEVCLILKAFYCPLHRVNRQISLWADVIPFYCAHLIKL